MRTRRALAGVALAGAVGGVVCAPAPAAAQGAASSAGAPAQSAAARGAELFKKSVDAYRRGELQQAVDLLTEAYALDPQPVLLYNMARAHEGLGQNDAAIETYERYLAADPSTKDRGAIEQRLVTLRRQREERLALEKREAERQEQERNRPVTPAPAPHQRSVLPYVVAGVGAVGLGLGVAFGLSANSKRDDAVAEPTNLGAIDAESDAKGLATASTVSFVVGGLLVAAGATWWVLDWNAAKRSGVAPRQVRVGLGPAGLGLQGVMP